MGLTKQQMMEEMEQEEKQLRLDELVKDTCVSLMETVYDMDYSAQEYMYLLCCMAVCGGESIGWSPFDILKGVASLLPDELFKQMAEEGETTLRN